MKLIERLLYKINGLHYRQEYLCTALESFQQPLHLYLVSNGKVLKDITKLHCFTGYCPVIFAFPSFVLSFLDESIHMILTQKSLTENDVFDKKDAVAFLKMKKIHQQSISEDIAVFYVGEKGSHRLISSFHQSIIHLNNRVTAKKPGNVYLEGNLYDQVQIAYSFPRQICLVTVGENGRFNLFPTDLHGQVDEEYYIISLRHAGKACQQVESLERIVLSDMNAEAYKKVYALGKNHMKEMKELSQFDLSEVFSANFQLPLPKDVLAYKELQLETSFVYGIHKLLLFKIVSGQQISDRSSTLVHIHNVYATWRDKHGITSNYLLR